MNKLRYLFFGSMAMMFSAVSVFAQDSGGAADNAFSVSKYKAIGAGLCFGIAAGLGALGQGKVAAAGAEGAARNPGAAATIQRLMILGLALIESLVLFALLIVFAVLKP